MAALVTTVALFDGKGKASLKVRNSSSCFASSTSFLCCSSRSAGASGNSSPSPSFLGLPFFGFSSPLASSASSSSALPSTSIIGASSSSTSSGCFICSSWNSPHQSTTKEVLGSRGVHIFSFLQGACCVQGQNARSGPLDSPMGKTLLKCLLAHGAISPIRNVAKLDMFLPTQSLDLWRSSQS